MPFSDSPISLSPGGFSRRIVFVLMAAAAAAWCWLYRDYFHLLLAGWGSEDFSYAWFVPPVVVWLGWTVRHRLRRDQASGPWWGLLWLAVASALFVGGKFGGIKMLVFISMWASLVSFAGFIFGGAGLRALRMPILLGLFAVPLPPFIANTLSFRLRLVSSALAEWMLRLADIPVFRDGNIIDLGPIKLDVVDACSGLRYLLPALLMALLLGWLQLRRNSLRLALILVAFPVSIFANAFRITFTGVMVRLVGPSAAEGFFHDFSGWLVYVISLGVLILCCRLLGRLERNDSEPAGKADAGLPTPCAPGLALAVAAMLALGFLNPASGSAKIPPRQGLDTFPMALTPWEGTFRRLSPLVLRSLGASDYMHATYNNVQTGNTLYMLISWYGEQDGTNSAHAPTACMLGSGWSVAGRKALPPRESVRPFPVGQILLKKGGVRLVANYWFQQRGRAVTNEFLNKWLLFWDALTIGRTDGALVRMEVVLRPDQSVEDGQALIDDMTSRVVPLLPRYVPGRVARTNG